jgi:hypothetical protein
LFPSGFLIILDAFLISSMHDTCHIHLILPDLMTLRTFGCPCTLTEHHIMKAYGEWRHSSKHYSSWH